MSPVLNRLAVVQDLNPEVDKPGKRKKLDAGARAGSEDKDAGTCERDADWGHLGCRTMSHDGKEVHRKLE